MKIINIAYACDLRHRARKAEQELAIKYIKPGCEKRRAR